MPDYNPPKPLNLEMQIVGFQPQPSRFDPQHPPAKLSVGCFGGSGQADQAAAVQNPKAVTQPQQLFKIVGNN